ncbi:glycosyltransferase family 2 protein [Plantibacter flavus]|uniref:glycosyltransferase family 2 protein n=1 Tax=Plantibacter flavus TaxID=150123 RepID=UPI002378B2D5|nr:glycosyltransferase family 2 protein [Plantibacter flavus]MDD9152014.1 glycosyltransferase family 2 protein [Plantibacter flavus]
MHSETPAGATGRQAATSLVVAMLTFRRPDDLRVALPALIEQAEQVTERFERVEVLVVDNDPRESARAFVEAFPSAGPVVLTYRCESESGITAARNRALAEAAASDLLVFIDDDERPTERWLVDLVATFDRGDAVAVVGPVVSRFEREPSAWIQAGEFFTRRRMPTGTAVSVAATNNLLIDLRVVRGIGLVFDTAFGHAGGEDTMFTRTLHATGGRLVWCDEAVVWDIVPAARSTRDWVVRRAFSSGNSWSQTSIALEDSLLGRLTARVRCIAKGLVRAAGGVARSVVGVVTRSLRHRAKGVRTLARGFGMIAGAVGYSYEEYRRVDA